MASSLAAHVVSKYCTLVEEHDKIAFGMSGFSFRFL